jgi:hypothetical protein
MCSASGLIRVAGPAAAPLIEMLAICSNEGPGLNAARETKSAARLILDGWKRKSKSTLAS